MGGSNGESSKQWGTNLCVSATSKPSPGPAESLGHCGSPAGEFTWYITTTFQLPKSYTPPEIREAVRARLPISFTREETEAQRNEI